MNNVFNYLWVKLYTFVTYLLLITLSNRSIKIIIVSLRSILIYGELGPIIYVYMLFGAYMSCV